jgi:multiple sugar transport system permease protein
MIRTRDLRSAMLFLGPNALGFLVFLAGPLVVSFLMAFTNWDLRQTVEFQFVGLRNFRDLWNDQRFWVYLINTLYLMLGIPFGIAGSLVLALLLNKPVQENTLLGRSVHGGLVLLMALLVGGGLWGMNTEVSRIAAGLLLLAAIFYALAVFAGVVVYRTMYYLPSFTSGVALFILWKSLYHPQTGPINGLLWWMLEGPFGGFNAMLAWVGVAPLAPPEWLQSLHNLLAMSPERPGFDASYFGLGAREAILFMGVVTSVGGSNMLLYLAGLSNVPQELYEAADVDGASRWQRFWNVTWPQLMPTTFFIVVMSCIGGLQGGFDVAKVMTNGGPSGTTTTLAFYIYERAFNEFRFGYASAVAWVLFLLVFVVTVVNWKFGNRQMNE